MAPERRVAAGSAEPIKKSRVQIKREVDEILASKPINDRAYLEPGTWNLEPGRRSQAQKKTLLKDIEPGLRNVAQRSADAENRFIAYAMEHGQLSRDQALIALAARAIKFDEVNGTFHVKHGQFLEPDVLRCAAGIEE